MWPFKRKRKPAPGEIWARKDQSPWTADKVKIVDVKKEWVRYQWQSSYTDRYTGDPRRPMKEFLWLYELFQENV